MYLLLRKIDFLSYFMPSELFNSQLSCGRPRVASSHFLSGVDRTKTVPLPSLPTPPAGLHVLSPEKFLHWLIWSSEVYLFLETEKRLPRDAGVFPFSSVNSWCRSQGCSTQLCSLTGTAQKGGRDSGEFMPPLNPDHSGVTHAEPRPADLHSGPQCH